MKYPNGVYKDGADVVWSREDSSQLWFMYNPDEVNNPNPYDQQVDIFKYEPTFQLPEEFLYNGEGL